MHPLGLGVRSGRAPPGSGGSNALGTITSGGVEVKGNSVAAVTTAAAVAATATAATTAAEAQTTRQGPQARFRGRSLRPSILCWTPVLTASAASDSSAGVTCLPAC